MADVPEFHLYIQNVSRSPQSGIGKIVYAHRPLKQKGNISDAVVTGRSWLFTPTTPPEASQASGEGEMALRAMFSLTASKVEAFARKAVGRLTTVSPLVLYGLRLSASVILVLFVAYRLELDNAFWAGITAAVVCRDERRTWAVLPLRGCPRQPRALRP